MDVYTAASPSVCRPLLTRRMDNKNVQNEFMKWYLPQLKQYEVGGTKVWSRGEPKLHHGARKPKCIECVRNCGGYNEHPSIRDAKFVIEKTKHIGLKAIKYNEMLCPVHAVDRTVYEVLPTEFEQVQEGKDEYSKSNERMLLLLQEEKLMTEVAELRAKIEVLEGK